MAIKTALKFSAISVAVLLALALIAPFVLREGRTDIAEGQTPIPLVIKSSSFTDGGTIPKKYTCLGENLSPSLEFASPPVGTKSIAIVMDDSDSPFGFVHWLVYNIPEQAHAISEGASSQKALPVGAAEGLGTTGASNYSGRCPPGNKPHRYVIRVYALATGAALAPGMTKQQLASAVEGNVLAEGQWTGIFGGDGT